MFEQKRPDLLNESRDRRGGLNVHTVNAVAGQSGNRRLDLLATPRRERPNEQVQSVCRLLGRNASRASNPDPADPPDLRLLCVERQRPRSSRASKKRDELASPQMIGPHVPPLVRGPQRILPKAAVH